MELDLLETEVRVSVMEHDDRELAKALSIEAEIWTPMVVAWRSVIGGRQVAGDNPEVDGSTILTTMEGECRIKTPYRVFRHLFKRHLADERAMIGL